MNCNEGQDAGTVLKCPMNSYLIEHTVYSFGGVQDFAFVYDFNRKFLSFFFFIN